MKLWLSKLGTRICEVWATYRHRWVVFTAAVMALVGFVLYTYQRRRVATQPQDAQRYRQLAESALIRAEGAVEAYQAEVSLQQALHFEEEAKAVEAKLEVQSAKAEAVQVQIAEAKSLHELKGLYDRLFP